MIQEKKYTVQELAKLIKAKYPMYNDMEDDVLVERIIEKYPVYSQYLVGEKEDTPVDLKKKEDFSLGKTDLDLPSDQDSLATQESKPQTEQEESFELRDYLGEFIGGAIDAGVTQGKTVDETLLLISKGKEVSNESIDRYISMVAEMDKIGPSKEMVAFQKSVENNGGDMFAFLKTLVDFDDDVNSSKVLTETFLTSFSGMLVGGAENYKKTLAAGGLGAATFGPAGAIGGAMGAAGGMLETAMSYTEFLKEELDGRPMTRENVREILNNDEVRKRITNKSLARGGIIGLIDGVSAGLAGVAAKSVGKTMKTVTMAERLKKFAVEAGTGAVIEGTGGGAGESLARAAVGQEQSAIETGLEIFGGAPKGVVTGPLGAIAAGKTGTYTINGERVSKEKAQEVIESATPEEASKINIEIKNDNKMSDLYSDKLKRYDVENNLPDDINETNKEAIIDLELKRKKLEGKSTSSAKLRIKDIEAQIKELSAPVEETTQETIDTETETQTETQVETKDQLQLLNEDNTPFERPEGSQLYSIGKTQKTVALVDSAGKLLGAFDSKTGAKRKTTASSEIELIKQLDYDRGKSIFDGVEPQERESTNDEIASFSENPKEVAVAFMQEKKKSDPEKAGSETLLQLRENKDRFTLNSLLNFFQSEQKQEGGQKSIPAEEMDEIQLKQAEDDLKRNFPDLVKWVAKDDQGINLEDLSNNEEVWELIKENTPTAPKRSVTETNLKERFKELTGLTGTDSQIQMVAEQDPSQLMEAREPSELQGQRRQEEIERITAEEEAMTSKRPVKETYNKLIKTLESFSQKIKKQTRKHFSFKGLKNDFIYKQFESAKNEASKEANKAARLARKAKKQLKRLKGNESDNLQAFDRILRGEVTYDQSTLPKEIKNVAVEMRQQIDQLSRNIKETIESSEGKMFQGALESIEKGLNNYLNRSYQLFSDKNWPNKVTEEIRRDAINYLRKLPKYSNKSEQLIEQVIEDILNKAPKNQFYNIGKDGKIDPNILKRRKDIPAPIRALMGEVTDPLENFINTIAKQAMTSINFNLQQKLANSQYFSDTRTSEKNKQFTSQQNKNFPELAGKWTTPEIFEALEQSVRNTRNWYEYAVQINGLVKWGKTVGSVATHVKNLLGNIGFVLANGHLSVEAFKRAANLVYSDLQLKLDKEGEAYVDKLISLGVIRQNTTLSDVKTAFSGRSLDEQMAEVLGKDPKGKVLFKNIPKNKTLKSVYETLNDLYQAEDDFFKIIAYEVERQRYSKALSDKSQAEIDAIVAENVKNTYPTYDRVAPLVKKFGRNPIFANFVSFRYESIRTAFNTYGLALKELSDPKLKSIGAKRIASALTYTSLKGAMAVMGGMSFDFLTGGEDSEEGIQDRKDLRRFVASWSKDSAFFVTGKEPGKVSFIDLSASDPHAFFSELIISGADEEKAIEMLGEKVITFLKPFVSEEILFRAFREVTDNADSNGKKIYDLSDGPSSAEQALEHLAKAIEPGTLSTIKRLLDEDKQLNNELLGIIGKRVVEVDIATSFYFKQREVRQEIGDAKSAYKTSARKAQSGKMSQKEIDSEYALQNEKYKKHIKNIRDDVDAALRLGVPRSKIKDILKRGAKQGSLIIPSLSKEDMDYIFNNEEPNLIIKL